MKPLRSHYLWMASCLFLLAVCGYVNCGCAHDPASRARQVVTGMYAGIGAASVAGLACDAYARHQADHGDAKGANDAYGACETLNASLHAATNATSAAVKSIDAGEQIGAKDYGPALVPLYLAGCDLQKAAQIVAHKIGKPFPVVIPCAGGQ